MIAAWFTKAATPFVAVAVLLAVFVGLAVYGLKVVDGMIERAALAARSERDHYWRGQIDQANTATQTLIAENLRHTIAAQNAARDQIAEVEARAAKLEKQNAALPDNKRFGLSRDRVRLLNKR